MAKISDKPHTERWAYRRLYTDSIFSLTSSLTPLSGLAVARTVSRFVAGFYAATQPQVVDTVHQNLKLLDPNISRKSAVAVFKNYGTCIADYISLTKLPDERVDFICGEFVGQEHIIEAANNGGAILATGHLGFFEFGSVVLGRMGLPVTAATMAEPTKPLTEWRATWRSRWGAETIEIGDDPFSSLVVQKSLAAGRLVAVLADRPMPGQGLPIDLPGGRTLFSTSPAVLSLLTRKPVIPVAVSLRPDGKYRVSANPPQQTARVSHDLRNEEVSRCTRAIAESLYEEIRRTPEQWFQFVPVWV
jgi:lauroyl/myristoyl acyltransferase